MADSVCPRRGHQFPGWGANLLLPPSNEVCEGFVFTRVCHSVQGGWYPSMQCRWYPRIPCRSPGGWVVSQHALQVSRSTSGDKLRGLAWRSLQAHTQGGSPGPHLEGYPSMHCGRPPTPAGSYCHGRYASYWNVFLFWNFFQKNLHEIQNNWTVKSHVFLALLPVGFANVMDPLLV